MPQQQYRRNEPREPEQAAPVHPDTGARTPQLSEPEQLRFGRELRGLRSAAGVSLAAFASRVHYSKAHLSKVERGLKRPTRELAGLCDAALRTGGLLTALFRDAEPAAADAAVPAAGAAADDEGEEWLMVLSPKGAAWARAVGRRGVVAAGAATLVGLGAGAAAGGAVPPAEGDDGTAGRPGPSGDATGPRAAARPAPAARTAAGTDGAALLETAAQLFGHYRHLGQSAGPEAVLPVLFAQTHTLRDAAGRADPDTRAGLLRLASRYAEYTGWLAQETGDERAALWWTRCAVEMAEDGGDRHLAAYAQVRRALISLYRGDAAHTVALARRAQRPGLPTRIRALAAQREAQGHALAGHRRACMTALDRVRELSSDAGHRPGEPVLGTSNVPDLAGMATGWCLRDLGRPREAAEELDRQLAALPRNALRTRTRFGMRRALAHAEAGELDHACALAEPLLADVSAVNSATIAVDLRTLARTLTRHDRRSAAVRRLLPDLTTHPLLRT